MEAEEIYEKLYQTIPENPDLWLDASELYMKLDDYAKATELIDEGLVFIPMMPELLFRKAGLLYLRGYVQEGKQVLASAVELDKQKVNEFFEFFPELMQDPEIIHVISNN
jgi:tetratricopeptide (TPR) repeat protein